VLWASCHLLVGVLLLLLPAGDTFWPGPGGSVVLTLAVPLLLLFDLKIQRLRVFLANLGISKGSVVLFAFVVAALLEISASSALFQLVAEASPR